MKKVKSIQTAKRSDLIFYIGWIVLPVIQFLIFYCVVNFNSFTLAFKKYNINTGNFDWEGFYNFKDLFRNLTLPGDPLPTALKNSLILYLCNTLIGVSLALVFSFYIYKKKFASEFFRVVLFLPQIFSAIVMVIVYKFFTDRAIPEMIFKLTGSRPMGVLSEESTRFGAIVFFNIWTGFGTNILMYVSAMTKIPTEITEAAALDGVSAPREFFQITLPLIYPTISAFMVIGITAIFTSQGAIYEFFGEKLPDGNLYTVGYYLFRYVLESAGLNNYAYASAVGIIATCIAAPITLTLRKVLDHFDPSREM